MSGAFFVIIIPTAEEEQRLRDKPRTSLFELKPQEKQLTPSSPKSSNVHYGTFQQTPKNARKSSSKNSKVDGNKSDKSSMKSSEDSDKYSAKKDSNVEADQPSLRRSWESLKDIMSSDRHKKKKEREIDLELPAGAYMETVLKCILKKFKIENFAWTISNDKKSCQVVFTIAYDEKYENILKQFNEWGIGDRKGSTVSILNCATFHTFAKDSNMEEGDTSAELNAQKQSAWNRFMNTMTARLNVAHIVRDVRQDAGITFDFVVLVVSAAILAFFGLVENSTIFLASSMLISPLMGPIIAAIFGTAIKDRSLQTLGVVNELCGIALATTVGFLFGLIICSIDSRYSVGEGLTTEILSRCELHSLVVGIFAAIPSGAAAAVGILGGNIGSLVGVAISASILPPAVNTGLVWSLACIYLIYETDGTRFNFVTKTNFYSDNQARELAILGSISMCITITNIICIYILGVVVLKIKEIAPVISKNNRQFWKHDIKIAREINKNYYGEDTAIAEEIAALPEEDKEAFGLNTNLFKSVNIERKSYQNTWSPMTTRHDGSLIDGRVTMEEFEQIYRTITRPQSDVRMFPRPSGSGSHKGVLQKPASSQFNLIQEQLRKNQGRASMTFQTIPANYPHANVKPNHLERISEVRMSSESDEYDKKIAVKCVTPKKTRKFTVTPTLENLN